MFSITFADGLDVSSYEVFKIYARVADDEDYEEIQGLAPGASVNVWLNYTFSSNTDISIKVRAKKNTGDANEEIEIHRVTVVFPIIDSLSIIFKRKDNTVLSNQVYNRASIVPLMLNEDRDKSGLRTLTVPCSAVSATFSYTRVESDVESNTNTKMIWRYLMRLGIPKHLPLGDHILRLHRLLRLRAILPVRLNCWSG